MINNRNFIYLVIFLFFNFYCSINAYINYKPKIDKVSETSINKSDNNTEFSLNLSPNEFVLEIPEKFKDLFYLEIVNVDVVTLTPKIRLKGYNKLIGNVFVNGKKVSCDRNGYFAYDYKLNNYGVNNIIVTFSTNSFQYLTVLKKVKYLFSPKFSSKDVKDKKLFSYFYNLNLVHNIKNRKLTDTIRRSDMAYFFYVLNKEPMIFNTNNLISDITKESWYYGPVQYSLEEGYLGVFPDGKFYPDKNVSMLELLVSLARYKKSNLNLIENVVRYNDFSSSHWASKFVQACLNEGLISPKENLYPNNEITIKEFISIVTNLESVIYLISEVENVDKTFEYPDILLAFHADLKKDLMNEKKDSENQIEFKLNAIDNYEILYDKFVTVNGNVIPSQPFYFDSQKVEPNLKGDFQINLSLLEGRNDFDVNFSKKNTQLTVFHLNNYKDLSSHWFEESASKLKFLNFLEANPTFNPKQVITRLDYVKYAMPFFENEVLVTENSIEITDLDSEYKYQGFIKFLIGNDIFSVYEDNKFYPNKPMKRVEALAATVKYLKFKFGNSENKKVKIPYWDIPKNHWAQEYVKRAYQDKLISESANFYPDKLITKDQLIALFSKLPNVELKVSAYFDN